MIFFTGTKGSVEKSGKMLYNIKDNSKIGGFYGRYE